MIEEVEIDLFDAPINLLCHQVNCSGVMNSGIAKQVRERYPIVYDTYLKAKVGDRNNLGRIQLVKVADSGIQWVCNMFSQFIFGYDGKRYTDYEAFFSALEKVKGIANTNLTIGFPYKIASDRGGADWNIIRQMIISVFQDSPRKVLICKKL